jgi:hypothetical protein
MVVLKEQLKINFITVLPASKKGSRKLLNFLKIQYSSQFHI